MLILKFAFDGFEIFFNVWSLFCCAVLRYNHSRRKRELVALPLLSSWYHVAAGVLWLFLAAPRVGLQCVVIAFSAHTHLTFDLILLYCQIRKMQILE